MEICGLNNEEKKAIEYLKIHILPYYGKKGVIEFMLNDILLNLIEKQSKEIEELSDKLTEKICKGVEEEILEEYRQTIIRKDKEIEELKNKNKKLQNKGKELIFEKQELTSALLDSTPNDKIKAKIEEMDNIISKNEQIIFNGRYEHLHTLTEAKIVKGELQSLLEKE